MEALSELATNVNRIIEAALDSDEVLESNDFPKTLVLMVQTYTTSETSLKAAIVSLDEDEITPLNFAALYT